MFDLSVHVDQERARQLAHLAKAPIRAGALLLGDAGLTGRGHDPAQEAGQGQDRRHRRRAGLRP